MDKVKENIVFDVCGTLYDSNTTFDFLISYFKKYNVQKYRQLLFWKSLPGKFTSKIFGLFQMDHLIRKKIIGLLKDEGEVEVRKEAYIFVSEVLEDLKIDFSHQHLENLSSENRLGVILASASIEPIISAISEKLGIYRYISTTLDVKNGRFTGKIIRDVQGKKHLLIRSEISELSPQTLTVFTDNKEDLDLVLQADCAYLMIYKSNEKFWCNKTKNHPNSKFVKV